MGYPSDISKEEWQEIAYCFEPPKPGRPSVHDKRTILNAILYLVKTGCQWRMIPKDLPPWRAVHSRYEYWCHTNAFEKALAHLNKINRRRQGKSVLPTLGIIDSQSVKTSNTAEHRDFDGNKKNKR
jgi:putative transposase